MAATEEFLKVVALTIEAVTEPSAVKAEAEEVGLPNDLDEQALTRLARRLVMTAVHSVLVIIDNGTLLALDHLLALVEVDDEGVPLPGGELTPGLHELAFQHLPEEYLDA